MTDREKRERKRVMLWESKGEREKEVMEESQIT